MGLVSADRETQGWQRSSAAVFRFFGSRMKQLSKNSFSSGDTSSGSGGIPSFTILYMAVIWLSL